MNKIFSIGLLYPIILVSLLIITGCEKDVNFIQTLNVYEELLKVSDPGESIIKSRLAQTKSAKSIGSVSIELCRWDSAVFISGLCRKYFWQIKEDGNPTQEGYLYEFFKLDEHGVLDTTYRTYDIKFGIYDGDGVSKVVVLDMDIIKSNSNLQLTFTSLDGSTTLNRDIYLNSNTFVYVVILPPVKFNIVASMGGLGVISSYDPNKDETIPIKFGFTSTITDIVSISIPNITMNGKLTTWSYESQDSNPSPVVYSALGVVYAKFSFKPQKIKVVYEELKNSIWTKKFERTTQSLKFIKRDKVDFYETCWDN